MDKMSVYFGVRRLELFRASMVGTCHSCRRGFEGAGAGRFSHLQEATDLIWSSMTLHHLMPGGLGSRAASLPRKAATLLAQLKLETHGASHLNTLLANVTSFCTDLGPEHGLADVTRSGFWNHFHTSLRGPHPILQDDIEAVWNNDVGDIEVDQTHEEHLFKRALPVAGLLHIVSNCTGDLHKGVLTNWDVFVGTAIGNHQHVNSATCAGIVSAKMHQGH